MESCAGASGSVSGGVALGSPVASAWLSLPRPPARKLFSTTSRSTDEAETGDVTAVVAAGMNVMVTWPGPAFTPEALSWLVPVL